MPITDRRQLTIYPESCINAQAAKAYEKLKNSKKIKLIEEVKILITLSILGTNIKVRFYFFLKSKLPDPTSDLHIVRFDTKG